jgi:hypothetical protein
VVDYWLLPNAVNANGDIVSDAAGRNLHMSLVAVQNEGHCHDGFQGVALSAAGRTDISLSAGNPDGEVQDTFNRFGRNAGPAIGNRDAGRIDSHLDGRRDFGVFARINVVVQQLLEHYQWPVVDRVAGLRDELLLATEI